MKFYNVGEAIEGAQCELYCRRPDCSGVLVKHPLTGKSCMRVEMSRNATAEISKRLELSDEELLMRGKVHLEVGDKLVADAITVYICQRRPPKFSVSEGLTHTHGGHQATTDKPTYCRIKYSHEHIGNGIKNRLDKKLKALEKKKDEDKDFNNMRFCC